MKFSILSTIAATTFAVTSATDCDLTKITPLLTNPNIATCTADSGFSFTAPGAPTAETLPKLCASTACKTVLTAVKALGLGDCTLAGMKLETDLITPIQTACAKGSVSSSNTTASAGSSTGSKSGTVTVGSTTAPTTTTTSSGSGSGASASIVNAPAPSTTAKSSAPSVVMATGAVVVAIAAAFL